MGKTQLKGLTLIPTRLYFRHGRVKCELAVAKGKQDWDKRETERRREDDREARAAMVRSQHKKPQHNHHNVIDLQETHADRIVIARDRVTLRPRCWSSLPSISREEGQAGRAADQAVHRGCSGNHSAAKAVSGREFAAGSCETVLLHEPGGLKAERLLIVGLGKLTPAEVRKAAGAAVRFAKPRRSARSRCCFPRQRSQCRQHGSRRGRRRHHRRLRSGYLSFRPQRPEHRELTLLAPGGAAESVYRSRPARGSHPGGGAELYPLPGQ